MSTTASQSTSTPAVTKAVEGAEPKRERKDDLLNFLQSFHCVSPVFPNDWGTVIRIRDDATVEQAFKKMITNQILSLPVVDHKSGKPLYVLGMTDLMAYFLKFFQDSDFKSDFWNKLSHWMGDTKVHSAGQKKLSVIEDSADYELDPVFTVTETDPLLAAVKLMLQKKSHRILVFNSKGELSNLITQSRVVQFIPTMLESIPKASKTIQELGIGYKNVVTINDDEVAYKAFKLMIEKKVSAVAVVTKTGELVGNISVSDFKLCGFENRFWDLLGLPVMKYLEEVNMKRDSGIRNHIFSWIHEKDRPTPVLSVRPTDTLAIAIKYLTFYRVHRVYITDDKKKLIGVISLHDILQEVAGQYQDQSI